jgi:hypothetical protein
MGLKKFSCAVIALFLAIIMVPGDLFSQAAVPVMTLGDGTTVSMTSSQLTALASQPGIAISATPAITAAQVAVPLPASLGGGFVIAEPAALAAGMNAVGVTAGATAAGVAGASAAAGTMAVGSAAGTLAAAGVGAGTIAAGAAAAAAATAAAVSATGGGGTTTSHH